MSVSKVCPSDHLHEANTTCYCNHGCRCEQCRTTHTARTREYRKTYRWRRQCEDPFAVDLILDGIPTYLTVEQRAQAVHRLWKLRWSDTVIAERLGCTIRTVVRIRRRLGLPGWEMWQQEKQARAA